MMPCRLLLTLSRCALLLPPVIVPVAEEGPPLFPLFLLSSFSCGGGPTDVPAVVFLDKAEKADRLAAARLVLDITLWESVIGMAAMSEIELVQTGTTAK